MPYVPDAILFDGTTDFMDRGAGLTGIVDSKTLSLGLWLRSSSDGGTRYIFVNDGVRFAIRLSVSNQLIFLGDDNTGTEIANMNSSNAILAGSGYHHVLISVNTATDTGFVFIDDVDRTVQAVPFTDLPIDLTRVNWSVGSVVGGSLKLTGAISDLWFSTEFIDISVEANRRKFIDAAGNPVFLGVSGEEPTGSPASVYLRGNQTDQGINSGTGGDFVSQATQVPGETTGPVANATSSASGLVNGPMFHELESAAGYITGPAFRLGLNKWTNQFVAPDTLCALEGSNDKLNWRIVADNFNRPISALADVMRVGGDRTTWLRFVVAADAMEPRLFTAIIQNRKLLEEGR